MSHTMTVSSDQPTVREFFFIWFGISLTLVAMFHGCTTCLG